MYLLYDYNIAKNPYSEPITKEAYQLLAKYIELEYVVLYTKKQTNEKTVRSRVVDAIMMFMHDTPDVQIDRLAKERERTCSKIIKFFLTYVDVKYVKDETKFPATILKNVLEVLNLVKKSSTNSGDCLDVDNPSMVRLKDFLKDSDYGSDEDPQGVTPLSSCKSQDVIEHIDTTQTDSPTAKEPTSEAETGFTVPSSNERYDYRRLKGVAVFRVFDTDEDIPVIQWATRDTFPMPKKRVVYTAARNLATDEIIDVSSDSESEPENKFAQVGNFEYVPTNFDSALDELEGRRNASQGKSESSLFPALTRIGLNSAYNSSTHNRDPSNKTASLPPSNQAMFLRGHFLDGLSIVSNQKETVLRNQNEVSVVDNEVKEETSFVSVPNDNIRVKSKSQLIGAPITIHDKRIHSTTKENKPTDDIIVIDDSDEEDTITNNSKEKNEENELPSSTTEISECINIPQEMKIKIMSQKQVVPKEAAIQQVEVHSSGVSEFLGSPDIRISNISPSVADENFFLDDAENASVSSSEGHKSCPSNKVNEKHVQKSSEEAELELVLSTHEVLEKEICTFQNRQFTRSIDENYKVGSSEVAPPVASSVSIDFEALSLSKERNERADDGLSVANELLVDVRPGNVDVETEDSTCQSDNPESLTIDNAEPGDVVEEAQSPKRFAEHELNHADVLSIAESVDVCEEVLSTAPTYQCAEAVLSDVESLENASVSVVTIIEDQDTIVTDAQAAASSEDPSENNLESQLREPSDILVTQVEHVAQASPDDEDQNSNRANDVEDKTDVTFQLDKTGAFVASVEHSEVDACSPIPSPVVVVEETATTSDTNEAIDTATLLEPTSSGNIEAPKEHPMLEDENNTSSHESVITERDDQSEVANFHETVEELENPVASGPMGEAESNLEIVETENDVDNNQICSNIELPKTCVIEISPTEVDESDSIKNLQEDESEVVRQLVGEIEIDSVQSEEVFICANEEIVTEETISIEQNIVETPTCEESATYTEVAPEEAEKIQPNNVICEEVVIEESFQTELLVNTEEDKKGTEMTVFTVLDKEKFGHSENVGSGKVQEATSPITKTDHPNSHDTISQLASGALKLMVSQSPRLKRAPSTSVKTPQSEHHQQLTPTLPFYPTNSIIVTDAEKLDFFATVAASVSKVPLVEVKKPVTKERLDRRSLKRKGSVKRLLQSIQKKDVDTTNSDSDDNLPLEERLKMLKEKRKEAKKKKESKRKNRKIKQAPVAPLINSNVPVPKIENEQSPTQSRTLVHYKKAILADQRESLSTDQPKLMKTATEEVEKKNDSAPNTILFFNDVNEALQQIDEINSGVAQTYTVPGIEYNPIESICNKGSSRDNNEFQFVNDNPLIIDEEVTKKKNSRAKYPVKKALVCQSVNLEEMQTQSSNNEQVFEGTPPKKKHRSRKPVSKNDYPEIDIDQETATTMEEKTIFEMNSPRDENLILTSKNIVSIHLSEMNTKVCEVGSEQIVDSGFETADVAAKQKSRGRKVNSESTRKSKRETTCNENSNLENMKLKPIAKDSERGLNEAPAFSEEITVSKENIDFKTIPPRTRKSSRESTSSTGLSVSEDVESLDHFVIDKDKASIKHRSRSRKCKRDVDVTTESNKEKPVTKQKSGTRKPELAENRGSEVLIDLIPETETINTKNDLQQQLEATALTPSVEITPLVDNSKEPEATKEKTKGRKTQRKLKSPKPVVSRNYSTRKSNRESPPSTETEDVVFAERVSPARPESNNEKDVIEHKTRTRKYSRDATPSKEIEVPKDFDGPKPFSPSLLKMNKEKVKHNTRTRKSSSGEVTPSIDPEPIVEDAASQKSRTRKSSSRDVTPSNDVVPEPLVEDASSEKSLTRKSSSRDVTPSTDNVVEDAPKRRQKSRTRKSSSREVTPSNNNVVHEPVVEDAPSQKSLTRKSSSRDVTPSNDNAPRRQKSRKSSSREATPSNCNIVPEPAAEDVPSQKSRTRKSSSRDVTPSNDNVVPEPVVKDAPSQKSRTRKSSSRDVTPSNDNAPRRQKSPTRKSSSREVTPSNCNIVPEPAAEDAPPQKSRTRKSSSRDVTPSNDNVVPEPVVKDAPSQKSRTRKSSSRDVTPSNDNVVEDAPTRRQKSRTRKSSIREVTPSNNNVIPEPVLENASSSSRDVTPSNDNVVDDAPKRRQKSSTRKSSSSEVTPLNCNIIPELVAERTPSQKSGTRKSSSEEVTPVQEPATEILDTPKPIISHQLNIKKENKQSRSRKSNREATPSKAILKTEDLKQSSSQFEINKENITNKEKSRSKELPKIEDLMEVVSDSALEDVQTTELRSEKKQKPFARKNNRDATPSEEIPSPEYEQLDIFKSEMNAEKTAKITKSRGKKSSEEVLSGSNLEPIKNKPLETSKEKKRKLRTKKSDRDATPSKEIAKTEVPSALIEDSDRSEAIIATEFETNNKKCNKEATLSITKIEDLKEIISESVLENFGTAEVITTTQFEKKQKPYTRKNKRDATPSKDILKAEVLEDFGKSNDKKVKIKRKSHSRKSSKEATPSKEVLKLAGLKESDEVFKTKQDEINTEKKQKPCTRQNSRDATFLKEISDLDERRSSISSKSNVEEITKIEDLKEVVADSETTINQLESGTEKQQKSRTKKSNRDPTPSKEISKTETLNSLFDDLLKSKPIASSKLEINEDLKDSGATEQLEIHMEKKNKARTRKNNRDATPSSEISGSVFEDLDKPKEIVSSKLEINEEADEIKQESHSKKVVEDFRTPDAMEKKQKPRTRKNNRDRTPSKEISKTETSDADKDSDKYKQIDSFKLEIIGEPGEMKKESHTKKSDKDATPSRENSKIKDLKEGVAHEPEANTEKKQKPRTRKNNRDTSVSKTEISNLLFKDMDKIKPFSSSKLEINEEKSNKEVTLSREVLADFETSKQFESYVEKRQKPRTRKNNRDATPSKEISKTDVSDPVLESKSVISSKVEIGEEQILNKKEATPSRELSKIEDSKNVADSGTTDVITTKQLESYTEKKQKTRARKSNRDANPSKEISKSDVSDESKSTISSKPETNEKQVSIKQECDSKKSNEEATSSKEKPKIEDLKEDFGTTDVITAKQPEVITEKKEKCRIRKDNKDTTISKTQVSEPVIEDLDKTRLIVPSKLEINEESNKEETPSIENLKERPVVEDSAATDVTKQVESNTEKKQKSRTKKTNRDATPSKEISETEVPESALENLDKCISSNSSQHEIDKKKSHSNESAVPTKISKAEDLKQSFVSIVPVEMSTEDTASKEISYSTEEISITEETSVNENSMTQQTSSDEVVTESGALPKSQFGSRRRHKSRSRKSSHTEVTPPSDNVPEGVIEDTRKPIVPSQLHSGKRQKFDTKKSSSTEVISSKEEVSINVAPTEDASQLPKEHSEAEIPSTVVADVPKTVDSESFIENLETAKLEVIKENTEERLPSKKSSCEITSSKQNLEDEADEEILTIKEKSLTKKFKRDEKDDPDISIENIEIPKTIPQSQENEENSTTEQETCQTNVDQDNLEVSTNEAKVEDETPKEITTKTKINGAEITFSNEKSQINLNFDCKVVLENIRVPETVILSEFEKNRSEGLKRKEEPEEKVPMRENSFITKKEEMSEHISKTRSRKASEEVVSSSEKRFKFDVSTKDEIPTSLSQQEVSNEDPALNEEYNKMDASLAEEVFKSQDLESSSKLEENKEIISEVVSSSQENIAAIENLGETAPILNKDSIQSLETKEPEFLVLPADSSSSKEDLKSENKIEVETSRAILPVLKTKSTSKKSKSKRKEKKSFTEIMDETISNRDWGKKNETEKSVRITSQSDKSKSTIKKNKETHGLETKRKHLSPEPKVIVETINFDLNMTKSSNEDEFITTVESLQSAQESNTTIEKSVVTDVPPSTTKSIFDKEEIEFTNFVKPSDEEVDGNDKLFVADPLAHIEEMVESENAKESDLNELTPTFGVVNETTEEIQCQKVGDASLETAQNVPQESVVAKDIKLDKEEGEIIEKPDDSGKQQGFPGEGLESFYDDLILGAEIMVDQGADKNFQFDVASTSVQAQEYDLAANVVVADNFSLEKSSESNEANEVPVDLQKENLKLKKCSTENFKTDEENLKQSNKNEDVPVADVSSLQITDDDQLVTTEYLIEIQNEKSFKCKKIIGTEPTSISSVDGESAEHKNSTIIIPQECIETLEERVKLNSKNKKSSTEITLQSVDSHKDKKKKHKRSKEEKSSRSRRSSSKPKDENDKTSELKDKSKSKDRDSKSKESSSKKHKEKNEQSKKTEESIKKPAESVPIDRKDPKKDKAKESDRSPKKKRKDRDRSKKDDKERKDPKQETKPVTPSSKENLNQTNLKKDDKSTKATDHESKKRSSNKDEHSRKEHKDKKKDKRDKESRKRKRSSSKNQPPKENVQPLKEDPAPVPPENPIHIVDVAEVPLPQLDDATINQPEPQKDFVPEKEAEIVLDPFGELQQVESPPKKLKLDIPVSEPEPEPEPEPIYNEDPKVEEERIKKIKTPAELKHFDTPNLENYVLNQVNDVIIENIQMLPSEAECDYKLEQNQVIENPLGILLPEKAPQEQHPNTVLDNAAYCQEYNLTSNSIWPMASYDLNTNFTDRQEVDDKKSIPPVMENDIQFVQVDGEQAVDHAQGDKIRILHNFEVPSPLKCVPCPETVVCEQQTYPTTNFVNVDQCGVSSDYVATLEDFLSYIVVNNEGNEKSAEVANQQQQNVAEVEFRLQSGLEGCDEMDEGTDGDPLVGGQARGRPFQETANRNQVENDLYFDDIYTEILRSVSSHFVTSFEPNPEPQLKKSADIEKSKRVTDKNTTVEKTPKSIKTPKSTKTSNQPLSRSYRTPARHLAPPRKPQDKESPSPTKKPEKTKSPSTSTSVNYELFRPYEDANSRLPSLGSEQVAVEYNALDEAKLRHNNDHRNHMSSSSSQKRRKSKMEEADVDGKKQKLDLFDLVKKSDPPPKPGSRSNQIMRMIGLEGITSTHSYQHRASQSEPHRNDGSSGSHYKRRHQPKEITLHMDPPSKGSQRVPSQKSKSDDEREWHEKFGEEFPLVVGNVRF